MSFRIDPGLPLTSEVRRIAREEIRAILKHLDAAPARPDKSLHGCRRRIKRLRSLLRLVRSGDRALSDAENARYRDISASLAILREATAQIETVDRMIDANSGKAAGAVLMSARRKLRSRRDSILANANSLIATVEAAALSCRAGLKQIDGLALPDDPELAADILADGARRAMRKARDALVRAGKRGAPEDFHDLRKAVKAHATHLALLGRLWPAPVRAQRKAVDALGEELGELHDILVMRAKIARQGGDLGSAAETKSLDKLLRRAERKLARRCLKDASRLFSASPKRAARKLAKRAGGGMAEDGARQSSAPSQPLA